VYDAEAHAGDVEAFAVLQASVAAIPAIPARYRLMYDVYANSKLEGSSCSDREPREDAS
jgi:hypothetical protein